MRYFAPAPDIGLEELFLATLRIRGLKRILRAIRRSEFTS